MTAGAGAHDEGNLGDHTRRQGIAVENLGIEAQRDHTLLDAGAGAFVNTNERHASFNGQVHDLDDFFAVNLTERPTENGPVLRKDAHFTTINGAVAGNHTVGNGTLGVQAEILGSVASQGVDFYKGTIIEQIFDAFPGGFLSCVMDSVYGCLSHGSMGFGNAGPQISELSGSGG